MTTKQTEFGGCRYGIACLLALLVICPDRAVGFCPKECNCIQNTYGVTVDCRSRDFKVFPPALPSDLVDFYLGFNRITSAPDGKLPPLDMLEFLEAESNLLTVLYDGMFRDQPKLRKLRINDNRIYTVQPEAFQGLNQLQELSLENNQITNLSANVFPSSLEVINLRGNRLEALEPYTFPSSSQAIYLDSNNLQYLDKTVFQFAEQSVKNITVSRNRVSLQIYPNTFKDLNLDTLDLKFSRITDASFLANVKCRYLDISGNPLNISAFTEFENLKSVEILRMTHMELRMLTGTLLSQLTSVRQLDVSHNRLHLMDGNILEYMPRLTHLSANTNRLARFPLRLGEFVPDLTHLHLASNEIPQVQLQDIENLPLVELDMSYNKIQTLHENLADTFEPIDKLDFTGNAFHCNCDLAWFARWLVANNFRIGVSKCESPNSFDFQDASPEDFKCKPPEIIYKMADDTLEAGSDLVLKCTATGDPSPVISLIAPSGDNIRLSPPRDKTDLVNRASWILENLSVDNAGAYLCIADNGHGQDRSVVNIDVTVGGLLPYNKSITRPTPIVTHTHTPPTTSPTSHSITQTVSVHTSTVTFTIVEESQTETNRGGSLKVIHITVIIIVSSIVAIAIVILLIVCVKRQRRMKDYDVRQSYLLEYHVMSKPGPNTPRSIRAEPEAHPMLHAEQPLYQCACRKHCESAITPTTLPVYEHETLCRCACTNDITSARA